jgi:hypothetical protein
LACSSYGTVTNGIYWGGGRAEIRAGFWWESLMKGNNLEDQGANGRNYIIIDIREA